LTELKQEERTNIGHIDDNNLLGKPLQMQQKRRLIFQVDEGHNSRQTEDKYRSNFRLFLKFIKIHDLDVLLDLGKEAIQELVIKYAKSLRDDPVKKYKRGTVHNRIASVLYFFENNDIELNKRKIRRYYPTDESVNDDRPYTVNEIQRMLSVADLRTKAMILLMVSTGMRIGALHSLRIEDLQQLQYCNCCIYKIQVYARTKDRYYTFCTPESAKSIDEYLDYRVRCGEVLKDKDESPLFRKHFNKDDPFHINIPEFMSQPAVMKAINECLKKAGVKSAKVMRSHAFRKGFKSIAEQSGMKSINVEILLGHDIGVSGHYYRPSEQDLLQDFMSHAVDSLTIDPNQRLQSRVKQLENEKSEEIERLKAQLQGFKDEQARAQDTSRESIRELRKRLDATEDNHERAFLALEHTRKVLLRLNNNHRQNDKDSIV
jgi:integrase